MYKYSVYIIDSDCLDWLYSRTPVERPPSPTTTPLIYDHILCGCECFLFVRSLTNDHPSDDRVRWDFLPRERPPRIAGGGSTSVPNYVLLRNVVPRHLSSNSIDLNFLLFGRRRYNDVLRSTLPRYDVASPPALRHSCNRPNSSALNQPHPGSTYYQWQCRVLYSIGIAAG